MKSTIDNRPKEQSIPKKVSSTFPFNINDSGYRFSFQHWKDPNFSQIKPPNIMKNKSSSHLMGNSIPVNSKNKDNKDAKKIKSFLK